jgi:type II secretion system protein H
MTHSTRRSARAGVTLIELLVVIVILSLVAGIAVASFRGQRRDAVADRAARIEAQISAARREAIRLGHVVVVRIDDGSNETNGNAASRILSATAFPDGSILADSLLSGAVAWDRLTGTMRKEVGRAAP